MGVTFNLKENVMDEFYILIIFMLTTHAAIIFYLFPWLDRRAKRQRYYDALLRLDDAKLNAPEGYAGEEQVRLHERRCERLREEMSALNVDPFDAIKPF